MPQSRIALEYSPESFTGTEMDFANEIVEAVMAEWGPTPEHKMILNLPSTVEMSCGSEMQVPPPADSRSAVASQSAALREEM